MEITSAVDLIVFAGQSNMAGRGDAEDAPECLPGAGYEYKAVSAPEDLIPIQEPFGLHEDRANGLSDWTEDGGTKRSGSMVTALVNEYYRQTGHVVIGVSASKGGTSTEQWKKSYISDAVSRLESAKCYLSDHQIAVRDIYVVWCQGETDGDHQVTKEIYKKNTQELMEQFKKAGASHVFLLQIGHFNYLLHGEKGKAWDKRYEVIRQAQEELCRENGFFTLAASFEPYLTLMRDSYHYFQRAYDEVGTACGKIMAEYKA